MALSHDKPLRAVCRLWVDLMEKAQEHKETAFGRTANECWRFFDEAHDFMYKSGYKGVGLNTDKEINTTFKATVNKVSELVQIFGPAMYFKNPHRQVSPKYPVVPEILYQHLGNPMQAQAFQQQLAAQDSEAAATSELLQWFLNYTPNELGLYHESRGAIDEALIKGRGVLWHSLYLPPGSRSVLPRSSFDSVDNLLIDPDATSLRNATWIARKVTTHIWQVERDYGLKPGSLKKNTNLESVSQQAYVDSSNGTESRRRGETADMVTFYQIWSKCGLGQHLSVPTIDSGIQSEAHAIRETLEQFGDHVYLVVAPNIDYPINLPPEIQDLDVTIPENLEMLTSRVRWPIPYWADDEWPCTMLDYHPVPGCVWPQAHMKPGLGELKLLNWIFSFLASRIRWTSRLLIAYTDALEQDIVDQLENGEDLTTIPFKSHIHGKLADHIQMIDFPPVQKDIWEIAQAVMEMFDKRVGLTPLLYGMTGGTQERSASESQIKQQNANIRIQDLQEVTEAWQTTVARKEALATRWFVGPESVANIFGEPFNPQGMQIGMRTLLWNQLVYLPLDYNNPDTIDRVVREYMYRIESGSIRKPNRAKDIEDAGFLMQSMFGPVLQMYQQTGDPQQLNALMQIVQRAYDLDPMALMFPDYTQQVQAQQQAAQQQQMAEQQAQQQPPPQQPPQQ